MIRITTIVWMLSVCMPETLLAEVVFEAEEIDSSTVKPGAFVEIIYGRGERDSVSGEWERLDTARGYIQAVDAERLIIGEQFWKKEIALERVQKLTILEVVREVKKSVIKSRRGVGLNIEIGWNGGVNPYDVSWISNPGGGAYAAGFDTKTRQPWSVSFYFSRFLTGERRGRLGIKYIRQVVETDARGPFPKHSRLWMSSLLLNYQFVVLRSTAGMVVAEIAMGKSLTNDDFRYCDGICFPASSTHISSGLVFILPFHRSIGVQAAVRANLYKPKPNESITPFKSGISLAIGPLLEF